MIVVFVITRLFGLVVCCFGMDVFEGCCFVVSFGFGLLCGVWFVWVGLFCCLVFCRIV